MTNDVEEIPQYMLLTQIKQCANFTQGNAKKSLKIQIDIDRMVNNLYQSIIHNQIIININAAWIHHS